ncbi:general secretion pathway protein E [Lebetimonas natsushimae]|uniref:General secretion pathway protein E n=1 Tax=Lebetimonas natsushimae TaxID=1936991 RepID=A0A292YD70_9BACT|nr:GspE/PulE family protein [Lebetimonas natsushimae]GAX87386.1 general secretion pathway protein E [Lebetimonas natsushimae]
MVTDKNILNELLKNNKITEEQYKKIVTTIQNNPKEDVLSILFKNGYITKEEYLKYLSLKFSINYVTDLSSIRFKNINIPVNILKQTLAVPIEEKYNKVKIAIADPLDWNAQAILKRFYPQKEIEFVLGLKEDILKVLKLLESKEKIKEIINDIKKELKGAEVTGDETAVMRLIKYLISASIEKKASDIHIEADEDGGVVRIRVLGDLYEMLDFDHDVFNALDSRIKILANMDVSEKRIPQDGSFSMVLNGNQFDFRVSTLPTIWGESIVIRILDKRSILKKIDEIGITPKNLELLKKALSMPNGIFLVTGPTGSGKSTTLYAALHEIAKVNKKVITVEDPVEYKLHGIQQVQVNPKIDMTFANALRSILRQDPDIIMIGEIRDLETLEIAIKAALTGHLVLSTLHTNDAVSSIQRMIDMGADAFMVATALIGAEAQRLVKTICPYCKTKHKPEDIYLDPIKNLIPKDAVFYKGRGCEHCNFTGYGGRTLISEIFLNDEKLESMISKEKEKIEILHYLRNKGYQTMFYDGLIKALKGITTLEDIYKVAKL